MSISSVSPTIASSINPAAAAKPPATPVQQASNPPAPPAVKAASDSDGDNDGSGRVDVKA